MAEGKDDAHPNLKCSISKGAGIISPVAERRQLNTAVADFLDEIESKSLFSDLDISLHCAIIERGGELQYSEAFAFGLKSWTDRNGWIR